MAMKAVEGSDQRWSERNWRMECYDNSLLKMRDMFKGEIVTQGEVVI